MSPPPLPSRSSSAPAAKMQARRRSGRITHPARPRGASPLLAAQNARRSSQTNSSRPPASHDAPPLPVARYGRPGSEADTMDTSAEDFSNELNDVILNLKVRRQASLHPILLLVLMPHLPHSTVPEATLKAFLRRKRGSIYLACLLLLPNLS
ncbi:hypothetical protein BOTBODRAFT_287885 [Botryobasidium botryosum FD-172 SS1]|uniref:Uncharacterized protein n=1 Tax=Botryobasidium botryosum (strain FD-172 SS1) TaxID=930990 RepID=A0A067M207_BOTB1|nr:hypothetical protein BOTBODRAFT_287885 [Botryobasidium botryosum FD-172 SS1]